MIRTWYDINTDTREMRVSIDHLSVIDAPRAPLYAEFSLTGGISLDYDGADAGWDESVTLRPESLAVALMRLAWVAAWHELHGSGNLSVRSRTDS